MTHAEQKLQMAQIIVAKQINNGIKKMFVLFQQARARKIQNGITLLYVP